MEDDRNLRLAGQKVADSYVMQIVFEFLEIELAVKLQGLSRVFYRVAVPKFLTEVAI